MKKWALAAVLSLSAISSVWAAQTPVQPQTMMSDMHKSMAQCQSMAMNQSSEHNFSQLNQHEKAAVALEFTPNGQSGPAHAAAERHLAMINS